MSVEILKKLDRVLALLEAKPERTLRAALRLTNCTQTAFDKLPATVSRQEFMDWTGYSASELHEEVKAARIKVYKPAGHTRARYYKHEIGRLGNWKM